MHIHTLLTRLKPERIRSQLILGIAIIHVVLMTLFVAELVNRQKTFFLKLNHDRAASLSFNLANIADGYINSGELSGLGKVVSGYKTVPGIAYALVTSENGLVYANTNVGDIGLTTTDSVSAKLKSATNMQILVDDNTLLDIASPIITGNKIVGWARIGLSQEYVETTLTDIRNKGIFYIFLSLVVGIAFAIAAAGRLSMALQNLVAATEKIKGGNSNIRIAPSAMLEISQLGTAFNQMLDNISANEKLLSTVLENMPIAVWIINDVGRIVSMNPQAKALWKGEQYVAVDDFKVYRGWSVDSGKELESNEWGAAIAFKEGKALLNQEVEIECFDQSRKTILSSAIPMFADNGNVNGVVVINVDITDRKRIERDLQKSNEEYSQLFNQMLNGLMVCDVIYNENGEAVDHMFVQGNPAFEALTGLKVKEQLGRLSKDFDIGSPAEVLRQLYHVAATGESIEYERTNQTLNKTFETRVFAPRKGSFAHVFTDVTQRKKAEEELRESKETLELFIEHSPASLAMFDTDMRYITTSRRWKTDYNLGNQQLIGKTHYEIFPEIGQDWKDIHQRCLEGAVENREEDSFTRTDGTIDWLRWEIRPWYKASGDIGGIIMLTEVLTEKKERELQFKSLVEKSFAGVCIVQKSKYKYVNPRVEHLLGYTPEEMLQFNDVQDVLVKEAIPEELKRWRKNVNNGIIEDLQIELQYRKKDGAVIWIDLNISQIQYKGERALLGTLLNITERKNAEAILKEQAETFAAIIDNTKESILLLSPSLKVLQGNKTFKERIYKASGKEVKVGEDFDQYIYPGTRDIFHSMFNAALANNHVDREIPSVDRDGELFWMRTRMYPIYNSKKELIGITVLVENISDRKNAEKQLLKINHDIGERVKELRCLYHMSQLVNDPQKKMSDIFQECANIIPPSYQYPEITCAQVTFLGEVFQSAEFSKSKWKHLQYIYEKEKVIGKIEVYYKKEMPQEAEGPFLAEERLLLTSVADMLRSAADKRSVEEAFRQQAETFELIIENTNESIWLLSPEMKVLQYNKTAKTKLLINGAKEIYKGADFNEFLYTGSEEVFYSLFNKALTGEYAEVESCQSNNLGEMLWLRTRMFPVSDATGKLKGITVLAENITGRKNTELVLEQSEEKFRALIENINDGIVLVGEDMGLLYQSPSVERIVGYTVDDHAGKKPVDFIHAEDVEIFLGQFEEASAAPGILTQRQYRSCCKDGRYIWLDVFIINLLHNKSVNAYVMVYRDITERRALEEQQKLFASIVNSTDDAIISKKLDGTVTSWNRGAEMALGFTAEEMIGSSTSMFIPEDLMDEEIQILKNIANGKSVDHFETKRRRKNGKIIDVSLTVSPIIDSSGVITGASKILRDVTDAKKAEEKIRQSEANYRQLFDLSPAPMCVIDAETTKFLQVNRACLSDYRYSEQEFFEMKFDEVVFHDNSSLGTPQAWDTREQTHIRRSGEHFDVRLSSIPIELEGKSCILVISIDVTEKNLYEQQLAQASIKAQEEERYEIGSELHDDVGQLLMSSLIFLGGFKEALPPGLLPKFEETKSCITRASREIRNLSHRLAPTFFDHTTLREAFGHLLASFHHDRHKITLHFDDTAANFPLERDLQLNLFRILQEQLKNIFKHAQASAINVSLKITPSDVLELKISDNGVGFNTDEVRGGIGLANMQRRVRLFNGTLKINSSKGDGCDVLVHVPIKSSGNAEAMNYLYT